MTTPAVSRRSPSPPPQKPVPPHSHSRHNRPKLATPSLVKSREKEVSTKCRIPLPLRPGNGRSGRETAADLAAWISEGQWENFVPLLREHGIRAPADERSSSDSKREKYVRSRPQR